MTSSRDEGAKRLLHAFAELVLEKSYYDIAVNEIARRAGLSTSSFYTYFKSKEDMLREFVEYTLDVLRKLVDDIREVHDGLPERVRLAIRGFSGLKPGDTLLASFHRVFRELEFIDFDLSANYYTRAIEILGSLLSEYGISDQLSKIASVSMLGASHSIYLFRRVLGLRLREDLLVEAAGDLILKGIVMESPSRVSIPPRAEVEDILTLARRYGLLDRVSAGGAKRKLLEAALVILSKKSFRETKVFELSSLAGYSVGMFYKNYKGKNEFLAEVVRLLGSTVRRYLTICTKGAKTGFEAQVWGLACFLDFVATNRAIYRIVRESEYIDPSIAGLYYEPFARRYAENLRLFASRGDIVTYDPFSTAVTLMGINHLAGIAGSMLGILGRDELVEGIAGLYGGGLLRLLS